MLAGCSIEDVIGNAADTGGLVIAGEAGTLAWQTTTVAVGISK